RRGAPAIPPFHASGWARRVHEELIRRIPAPKGRQSRRAWPPRDTSACTRPAAPCRCCGTPPRHFLAWLGATGQRVPRGTVLDDVTEITMYYHPPLGVNAAAGDCDGGR